MGLLLPRWGEAQESLPTASLSEPSQPVCIAPGRMFGPITGLPVATFVMTEDCVLDSHNPASLAIVTAVPLLRGDAVHLAYFGSGSKII